MENPNILDLEYSVFRKIQTILENPNTMRSFLEVLPSDCSCEDILVAMDIESKQYNMTPAKILLRFLGSKGFTVSDLIRWFEAIGLEKALAFLKKEEPLKIIAHPQKEVRVNESAELFLTCIADSYPPPEYQWFKDDKELLLQIDHVFSIDSTRLEDSGIYTCRVTKWDSRKNAYEWLYSDFANVEVIPTNLHAIPPCDQEPQSSFLTFGSLCTESSSTSGACSESLKVMKEGIASSTPSFLPDKVSPLLENNCVLHSKQVSSPQISELLKKDVLTITKHPYFHGRIAQGMSLCLTCDAVSNSDSVNFQWFKNRRPLIGETSSNLVLSNLYPDPDTGERKWDYQCEVSNEFDRVLSKIAVVELDDANDTTPYIAHQKYAFMVANDTYDCLEHLRKPAADVKDMANILSLLGFKIFAFRNLTLTEMRNAFTSFCQMLVPGSYALFFFAGHGFDLYGQTYLQPVDSSENCLQRESLCAEYILQCLQERKPAMNILIIDACRKMPPNFSSNSKSQDPVTPGRIFQAKMKNNTIYFYSTSFLCSSHESDEESNSVFVKHLKKYLAHNKCIEDILRDVKKDFAKDPVANGVQFPTITSTLAEERKLCDPVQDSSSDTHSYIINWCDIRREVISESIEIPKLKAAIIVEFHHHMEVFCNGMDMYVYLHIEPDPKLFFLCDMEINISFLSPMLNVVPINGVALKDVDLVIGRRNLLFKKEIFNMQKLSTESVQCRISMKYCPKNVTETKDFNADVARISKLQLSVNHLAASNVEDPSSNEDQTTTRNLFI